MRLPHRLFLIVLAGLVWLVGSNPLQARPADVVVPDAHQSRPQAQQSDEPLRVVTKVFEPFVIKDGDDFKGFSIDLWTEIVRRMGRQYEFIEVETVDDQLAAVAQGKADVAIAGITMTSEREHSVDFSYPYFKAGLQIMTRRERSLPFVNLMTVIFNPAMLEIVGIFFLIMLIAAHAVWLVERRNNPDFPQTYWRGIWEALWWSAVTVTTVGYGDKTPRGFAGRMLGLFWMFAGLFLIAHFTAGITALLTLQQWDSNISTEADLHGRRVATVQGSTSDDFLREQRISATRVESIEEAYDLLAKKRVHAIVYDAPVLLYYITTNNTDFQVTGEVFATEHYGIALPMDSPYREAINLHLLEIMEDGTYNLIYERWFGVTAE